MFTDRQNDTTYVALLHPSGGPRTLRPLPGSARIISVLQSESLPSAKITARITKHGCRKLVRYRLTPARGEQIILVAQDGNNRTVLGHPTRRNGHYTIPTFPGTNGRAQVIAFLARHGKPISTETIATFNQAAACGKTQ